MAPPPPQPNGPSALGGHEESETEDEEVKMNCFGGVRGIDDSDMNTTEGDLSASDAEDDDDPSER